MCGFVGMWSTRPSRAADRTALLGRMADVLRHRGPDDGGVWASDEVPVGFGFRRLSIIDTSSAGHQPMASSSGRYIAVFNGEVYNHEELRADLSPPGGGFRGHSDTETILRAFEEWGIHPSVSRFVGMFAIAVWDTRNRELTLIRDRLGIKPLYVYQRDGLLLFGSELKGLRAHPEFDPTLDTAAIGQYFRYLTVPAPRTVFAHAVKLKAGTALTLKSAMGSLDAATPYWSLARTAERGLLERRWDEQAALEELTALLSDSVRLRMRSDVPVGALLSGGIDSSLVTALMTMETPRKVRTFCIGFDDVTHDESTRAAAVARHLETDHTGVTLSGGDALEAIPGLVDTFDEPFANPSHIPTLLICQVARREVTVALSGDGGDEVFAGYNRYAFGTQGIAQALRWPKRLRQAAGQLLDRVPPAAWESAGSLLAGVVPEDARRLMGEKVPKFARLLQEPDAERMYRSLVSAWNHPRLLLLQEEPSVDAISRAFSIPGRWSLLDRMQLADQAGYLQDDLLTKVDRVSMSVSLEVRVPLIDHRVVEFAWGLPDRFRLRRGVTKWLLRTALSNRIPADLLSSPKIGFTVPLAEWLGGPLRPWAEELLAPDRVAASGHLRPEAVSSTWKAFLRGRVDLALQVWTVLMFEAWRERWT